MPTNDFIGFASSGSANVMSQADFAAAHEQLVGVQPGPATSALANKIWRQGSNMAAALGDLMSAQGYDALDDGDISKLAKNLSMAVALTIEYNATYDFKSGSICRYIGDLYVALVDNGPGTSVKNPTDTTAWAKVILTTATTSAAGYMSAEDKKKLDDIDIFVESGSTAAAGLVPKPSTTPGTSQYLCEDATWKVPPFVPKGNASVIISEEPINVATSNITAFKANGFYCIMFTILLKSGLATWTDYWIAHLDVTGGAPLRTFFTLTSQSNGLSVPCVCEADGNITLMQKGVSFSDDWLWGGAVVPINM